MPLQKQRRALFSALLLREQFALRVFLGSVLLRGMALTKTASMTASVYIREELGQSCTNDRHLLDRLTDLSADEKTELVSGVNEVFCATPKLRNEVYSVAALEKWIRKYIGRHGGAIRKDPTSTRAVTPRGRLPAKRKAEPLAAVAAAQRRTAQPRPRQPPAAPLDPEQEEELAEKVAEWKTKAQSKSETLMSSPSRRGLPWLQRECGKLPRASSRQGCPVRHRKAERGVCLLDGRRVEGSVAGRPHLAAVRAAGPLGARTACDGPGRCARHLLRRSAG